MFPMPDIPTQLVQDTVHTINMSYLLDSNTACVYKQPAPIVRVNRETNNILIEYDGNIDYRCIIRGKH